LPIAGKRGEKVGGRDKFMAGAHRRDERMHGERLNQHLGIYRHAGGPARALRRRLLHQRFELCFELLRLYVQAAESVLDLREFKKAVR
jgi:hypothetical protein